MGRIHSIQYLRAIAALMVVTLHMGKRLSEDLPDALVHWLPLGNAGVDIFFVISGFIMWSVGNRRHPDPADFLLHRVIRVAPPYWIATFLWLGLMVAAGYQWITITPDHVLKSLAFIPHYSPTFPAQAWPVLVPGWTLIFEMFFYVVFAAVLTLPQRMRMGGLVAGLGGCVAMGAVLSPQAAWAVTYSSPLLLEFLGGCLVARLWIARPGGVARNLAVLAAGIAILLTFGTGVDPLSHLDRTLVWGSAGILIVSGTAGLGASMPQLPLLERLGDGSYAIYLFHLLLVLPLTEAWNRLPMIPHSAPMALLYLAATLAAVSALGLAIYTYVERPLQRVLTARLTSPRTGQTRLPRRWSARW